MTTNLEQVPNTAEGDEMVANLNSEIEILYKENKALSAHLQRAYSALQASQIANASLLRTAKTHAKKVIK